MALPLSAARPVREGDPAVEVPLQLPSWDLFREVFLASLPFLGRASRSDLLPFLLGCVVPVLVTDTGGEGLHRAEIAIFAASNFDI